MAERESATFDLLSIANAGIAKCVDQIYPLLYPQIAWSIAFPHNEYWDLLFRQIHYSVFYEKYKLIFRFIGLDQITGHTK